jgi:glycerol kinase
MSIAIALDLGSTSIKAGLLDSQGQLLQVVAQPAPAIQGKEGHYEGDALEYAARAEQVLSSCLAQIAANLTAGSLPLGLCSQRSSFLIWEKASGLPVIPFISWQDNRGAESCLALHAQEAYISELSGLRLTPYYLATKLRVLLRQHPHWRVRLLSGEWLLGTLDTFLIWRWTDGAHYITDASMAARTLLLDIQRQAWSPELCALFDIPLSILPAIRPSTGMNIRLHNGLTLQASVADQSAALLASVGVARDVALVNLGTGGFVMRNLPEIDSQAGAYLRTLVYQDNAAQSHIALEGTLNSIAAALADYPANECELAQLASNNIFCIAEPSGIGAPYFRQDIGLQFSEAVEHLPLHQLACLLLEAIIFRVVRILEEFKQVAPLKSVYLSGGLSELPCLQQGIALCAGMGVYKVQQKDASLQGAAMLAAGLLQAAPSVECIVMYSVNSNLKYKYTRWKQWLDELLRVSVN